MKRTTAFFLAAVGALSCEAVAQDRTIIFLPEPAFEGTIGKTYKESTAAWPKLAMPKLRKERQLKTHLSSSCTTFADEASCNTL